jgi:hypothetical protein
MIEPNMGANVSASVNMERAMAINPDESDDGGIILES